MTNSLVGRRKITIRDHLQRLGLELPPAQVVPPGTQLTYRRLVRWSDIIYIAGHGPTHGEGWGSPLGKVGHELTIEEGVDAARLTALNVLATIERELGNLDDVACWLKVNSYVNAAPGFTEQAVVANGFSNLLKELYGQDKLAARTTIGVPDLPFDMPIECDAVIAWKGS